ncbi:hypothetical protein CcCBS67573_g09251 [Chytriomyces confervae]|uniref:Uncharacterized protein n=1 Tax=Chytriomyces confervae TaxID=246404 RepID=A0A507E296_9FUNG|nr:hypothetical protein CcCBS67573_g09251 [Chytriomyces confervae]
MLTLPTNLVSDMAQPPIQSTVHVDRITIYRHQQSILLLTDDVPSGSLTVSICESEKSRPSIIRESSLAIQSFFSNSKVPPSRLIYITAGLAFEPTSPKPFGGPKTHPGYVEYDGKTVASLLEYLVESSFKRYWACRGREALDFVAGCVNRARKLHYAGNADILNELLLKGMKKSGHIAWNKSATIPEALRHRQEAQSDVETNEVQFTPRLSRSKHVFQVMKADVA